jgi:hypothetical protein
MNDRAAELEAAVRAQDAATPRHRIARSSRGRASMRRSVGFCRELSRRDSFVIMLAAYPITSHGRCAG